jgi:tetratricopeptide (TPR) repeat protein
MPDQHVSLPDTFTEAGRIAAELANYQHGADRDLRPAASTTTRAARRHVRRLATFAADRANAGRYAEAIAALRQAVALDPKDAQLLHDLGLVCLRAGRHAEAAGILRQAAALEPSHAGAQHALGRALDAMGQTRDAILAYKQAVWLQPNLAAALVRLAELQLVAGSRTEAEATFRAAAAAMPDTDAGRVNAARAALLAGAYTDSEALLRDVLARNPDHAEAHATLGKVLADTGQLAEAAAEYGTAATLDRNLAVAWYGCASNRKFTTADRPLIERMRANLDRLDLLPDHRMALDFALGKVHDDLGEYAEAMRYFEAANRIDYVSRKLDRAAQSRRIDRLIADSPPGFLGRRPDFETPDETPVLIVGMPRSGTTLVEQILSSHPAVAAGGELTYWSDVSRSLLDKNERVEVARRLATDYLALLGRISPDATRVTDKLPFNYEQLGLVRQVLPRAFVLHCRRHPVDTCWSIFTTYFRSRLADRGDLVFFYRQYERIMAHWRSVLPAERFFEIDYESLVADPEPLTRRLVAFCGLEWDEACLAPHRNRRPVTTASLWQARQPIYRGSVARWRRYEPWLGELHELLSADAQA